MVEITDEGARRLLQIRAEDGEEDLVVRIVAAPG